MHEITNANRNSPRSFNAGGVHTTLTPGETKSFAPGALSAGLLRVISAARSDLKLKNLSEEAAALTKTALARVKAKTFQIVHGAGDITVEEALRREKMKSQPVQVRDQFELNKKAAAKTQSGLADPVKEPEEVEDEEVEKKPERVKLEQPPVNGPVTALLAEVAAESITMKELRARAKDLLGDAYPGGTIGKDDIVEALKKAA